MAGINCWDLNEDGLKTMPDEDTNSDGTVDVIDCRALPPTVAASTTVIDPTLTDPTLGTGGITHQHSRTAYTTFKDSPTSFNLYTGTRVEYLNATLAQNYNSLDVYLADPVPDTCGLWKWFQGSTERLLLADDAFAYSTSHYPSISIDGAGESHFGAESCALSCLADDKCVGASYTSEDAKFSNTVICKRLQKSETDLAENSEFMAVQTGWPGWVAANMDGDFLSNGVISVCN